MPYAACIELTSGISQKHAEIQTPRAVELYDSCRMQRAITRCLHNAGGVALHGEWKMKRETIVELETNIDHLTGEELGMALNELNAMPEALDAFYINVVGKKNRPAGILTVLCHVADEDAICKAIFRHTHTLGIRIRKMERVILDRREDREKLCGETIAAKHYEIEGTEFSRPEADEIHRLARLRDVGAPAFRFGRKK